MSKLCKEMRDFMEMLWQTKRSILPVIVLSSVLEAAVPFWKLYFSAQILNHAFAGEYRACVESILWLFIGNFLISLADDIGLYMVSSLRLACREGIYMRIMKKMFKLEYETYEKGDIVDKVRHLYGQEANIGDVGYQIVYFHNFVIEVSIFLMSMAFVIYLLCRIPAGEQNLFTSPVGTVVLILLYALISFLMSRMADRKQVHNRKMNDLIMHDGAISSYMDDLMTNEKNARDIRVFRLQDFFLTKRNQYEANVQKVQQKTARDISSCGAVTEFLAHMATLVAYVFVGAKAYYGAIGFGDVLMYVGVFEWISRSIEGMFSFSGMFLFMSGYYRAYEDFLQQPDMAYDGTLPIEKRDDGEYEFEFHNVSFSYPETEEEVLHNVSLKFNIGETMAIVGRNGAGKSTIVKLLCRLYEPSSGYITLNGVDIRKYKYAEYVKAFSVVFQDFHLFSYGLDENVASGESIDYEILFETLEKVNLTDRIMSMEQKEKSRLYNNNGAGIDISGGEAQRLAIARALYKDAPFVILDEPTAALDPMAEAEIYEKFNQLVETKTAIYISHRMSSCKFCNRIVVLDRGSISECGTHEELIQKNGIYSELYYAQAKHYT